MPWRRPRRGSSSKCWARPHWANSTSALAHAKSGELACPGSLLRVRGELGHPVTYGLPDGVGVLQDEALAFETALPGAELQRSVLASYRPPRTTCYSRPAPRPDPGHVPVPGQRPVVVDRAVGTDATAKEQTMTTHVQYWGVDKSLDSLLPMTTQDMSAHLAADWTPWLPPADGSKLFGWPQQLVTPNESGALTLDAMAAHSERQWKGVVSWMLSVACSRCVLNEKEGYRWIAPASAFYRKATWRVELGGRWHEAYPQGRVEVRRDPASTCKLRPDYVALSSTATAAAGAFEWAAAEAKGTFTQKGLTKRNEWRRQAQNIKIHVDGQEVAVRRHLVIATRVAAGKPIQVRAWNSTEPIREPSLPPDAAVEIVAAHLFGLLRSLGLASNAQAIALGVETRALALRSTREPSVSGQPVDDLLKRAAAELRPRERDGTRLVDMDAGAEVEITEPVANLIRSLQRADSDAEAVRALQIADAALDQWYAATIARGEHDQIALPYGIVVRFPRDFART